MGVPSEPASFEAACRGTAIRGMNYSVYGWTIYCHLKNVNVVTVAMSSSHTLSRKITVLHNGEVDGGLCVIPAQQSSVRDDSTMS